MNKVKVIHQKYNELIDGHDNVSAILNFPPRSVSTYMCALFHPKPLLRWSHIQSDMFTWSHKSKQASSWMIKHLFLFYFSLCDLLQRERESVCVCVRATMCTYVCHDKICLLSYYPSYGRLANKCVKVSFNGRPILIKCHQTFT